MLDLERHWRDESCGDDRTAGDRCGVPVAGHHGRRPARGSRGAAEDRALAAAHDRAEHGAANRRATDLARALARRGLAFAVDRVGAQIDLASVGEHQRVEAHAEARTFLDLSAFLHQRDRTRHTRSSRNRQAPVGVDVARHPSLDAILDARTLAGNRRFDFEPDHGRRGNRDLFDLRHCWRFDARLRIRRRRNGGRRRCGGRFSHRRHDRLDGTIVGRRRRSRCLRRPWRCVGTSDGRRGPARGNLPRRWRWRRLRLDAWGRLRLPIGRGLRSFSGRPP